MDLQSLRFFKTIADTRSFTAASEELHYAQSNLSTQIMKLEKELGAKLFYRNKRGVELTQDGLLFYYYVNSILKMTEEAKLALGDKDKARGTLKIGSIEATALKDLPSLFRDYHLNYPEVQLSLLTDMNDVFPESVLTHKLEGAFISNPVIHPELESIFFKGEQLILVGSSCEPPCTADEILNKKSLITFPEGSAFRQRLELLLASRSIHYSDRLTTINSLAAMIANITAGLGFGYLPKSIAQEYITSGLMIEYAVDDPYSEFDVVFIYRKDHIMNAAFRYFLEMLSTHSAL